MNLTLHVWRQANAKDKGKLEKYAANDISPDMSFLEMLDVVNEDLIAKGIEPIVFDHDCREGICGTCSQVINGIAHGPDDLVTACQLHMRKFNDGDHIFLEPWRSRAFPVIKDLMVDRGAFDRIIQAYGYTSARTGGVPDGNAVTISKVNAERSMDAAACIGCGACVAACPNGSAMLFTAAKVAHLGLLPQGEVEAARRVRAMVEQMDKEGFGACTNHYECEAACPKGIKVTFISRMNRELAKTLPMAHI
ncbi:succinate dehydrogenase subunit B [Desulfuromonas soudanensis]|uniref:Succinate dehydrogenase subunit B n=1 Tax=Desulfuromonas soudanensis TaxID=1603606 RepID=A0A0M4D684_9BACT|nr:succinate dehydrogenase/fumarate reductase iron-sulfur subunit [Desulfuromonas soudanensis]ALC16422.1 succinate dehydrogenase subunit B [Desulfuromonas soudanensis]